MSPEFWYTTILFVIALVGAGFGVAKLVFKLGKFTQSLDNNLEASTETLMYVKGIDKRVIVIESEYVKESDFNALVLKVNSLVTEHNMHHNKKG